MTRKLAAWLVHAYTISGGVVAAFALIAVAEGRIREGFILLAVTLLIDGTDGMLARAVDVKKVLPHFDGAEVDNVIDFLTYVWLPVLVIWMAGILPHPAWIAVPVVAALYAYGQRNMKTEDGFFLGFPSYWNVVALYLYWLEPGPVISVLMLVIPGVLSFVPTRWLYPSHHSFLPRLTWAFTIAWALLIGYLLLSPSPDRTLVLISLFYPAYYTAASLFAEVRYGREERGQRSGAS